MTELVFCDLVIANARLMTCDPARPGLGIIDRGAIGIRGDKIVWVGGQADRPIAPELIDVHGQLITPGLIDCHTHAVFAGDRANEFAMRAEGRTYLEIARAGGGIAATLGPTRAASEKLLVGLATARLAAAVSTGTTTMEIKSGYDLTTAGELRLLRCIRRLAERGVPRVVPTLLAHVVPPERLRDRDAYIRELCSELIPEVGRQRLASSIDVYCDDGAYTLDETRQLFGAARVAGLSVRGHIGQFKNLGAAELLAANAALSADHLEHIDDTGIAALARAGIVGVMLPGACLQLRLPVPPVDRLRRAGVAMAIATDLNPGSSFSSDLPLQMWIATTHFGMTIEEAWLGVTRHAATALGRRGVAGQISVGAHADLVLWRCDDPATIAYRYGSSASLVETVYVDGAPVQAVGE